MIEYWSIFFVVFEGIKAHLVSQIKAIDKNQSNQYLNISSLFEVADVRSKLTRCYGKQQLHNMLTGIVRHHSETKL